jgi:hypothetical protein
MLKFTLYLQRMAKCDPFKHVDKWKQVGKLLFSNLIDYDLIVCVD